MVYEEDELPQSEGDGGDGGGVKCYTDGMFGDRRYDSGEGFYYDDEFDMYWRQGCKPRIQKMFGF